jgi:hypothetical protein
MGQLKASWGGWDGPSDVFFLFSFHFSNFNLVLLNYISIFTNY